MKRDDISVRVEDDEVIIQGERRQESSGTQRGYYRSERSYGSFYRTIPLPEGTNADTANATFRDGVLEIEFDMPRQQQRGRTLQIREGAQSGGQGGTASGATYGSGTTGSMEGATSGQQSQSGTGGSAGGGMQPSSGSGTMYSGSGNPSAGAAGMGGTQPGSATDRSGGKSSDRR
jgi:HSP20 family protein